MKTTGIPFVFRRGPKSQEQSKARGIVVETKLNIIDVNRFNPSVDWSKLAGQVDGVIIRVGYRGIKGDMLEDPVFKKYLKGAIDAGIPRIGAYWWGAHSDAAEADVDAAYVMTHLTQYKDQLNFGVWLFEKPFPGDCEYNRMSPEERTECAIAFMDKIQTQGLASGVYASEEWFADEMILSKLEGYSLWVAAQGDTPPEGVEKFAAWQYNHAGKVDGVSRDAGQSWFYQDFAAK